MARRVCQTVPGDSVCCIAAQRGLLGRPITFTTRSGTQRCGVCNVVPSRSTNPVRRAAHPQVFQFRFAANRVCGIVSGCAALSGGAGTPNLAGAGGILGGQQVPLAFPGALTLPAG